MTIEELKSGSYRVKQMVNGVVYRVTVDHEPKEKEAHLLIAEAMAKKGVVTSSDIPFKLAYKAYIESKADILSPSTIGSGYNSIIRQVSEGFMNTPISMITKPMVQAEVNRYSVTRSPKSTDNFSGLIISVLRYFGNDIKGIKRPQKKKSSVYIPTESEAKAIFNAIKGSEYEAAILLASMSLRRSEIAALQLGDLSDDNILTIDKALVQNEKREWVIKSTKTTESSRKIELPQYLADLIRNQGFVYRRHPEMMNRHLAKVEDELGINHFTIHKLRHFFASYLFHLGKYTDKQIQDMGGWKTNSILKTVYTHSMEMEKAKKSAANDLGSLM